MDERQLTFNVSPRELWFGVAAGPILWAIHLVVSYGLVSLHCNWAFFSFTMLGAPGIVAILALFTFAVLAVVVYAGIRARRNWNVMRQQEMAAASGEARTEERHEFLSISGALLSALFAAAILIALIPALVLGPCAVV